LTQTLYNTLSVAELPCEGEWPVVRCPECDAEVDVDEDEVEEGEILICPECDVELEVLQVHPVHLNVISDEDDEEEEVVAAADDGDEAEEDEEESEEDEPEE
jgi:alpha-aminoadipate carrier protein LysW